MTATSASPGVDRRVSQTRLARLPEARHPIVLTVGLLAVTLILGFTVKWATGLSATEFQVDQALSGQHDPILNAIALSINTALSPAGIVVISILLFLAILLITRSPINAIAVGAVSTIGWLSSEAFKLLVAQPRPSAALLADPLVRNDGSGSFPSGHTTFAVSLAIALCFLARNTRWTRLSLALGILFVVVVGASRLYLGVHYPSDVIGSVLVAATTISLVTVLWNRFALAILNRVPVLRRFGPIPPVPTKAA